MARFWLFSMLIQSLDKKDLSLSLGPQLVDDFKALLQVRRAWGGTRRCLSSTVGIPLICL